MSTFGKTQTTIRPDMSGTSRNKLGYVEAHALPPHHPARVWRPFDEVFVQFATDHPELRVGTHLTTRMRFVQAFRKELIESGAVIEIKRGTLLAHTDDFGSVAFALLACLPLPKFETVRGDRPAFVRPPPVPGRKRGRPRRAD